MKIGKRWLIVLIVGLLIGISTLNISYGQDFSIWENKWFKLTYTTKGYCELVENHIPFPSSDKLTAYLETGVLNVSENILEAYLHYYIDDAWTSVVTPLSYRIGNELDFICSSEFVGDPTGGFTARIKGKMVGGSLKSATFKTLWGYSYDTEGLEHCFHQATMSGKLVDVLKVPDELK